MELFSKLGIDWKILIAQIFNFFLLLVVLRFVLYKPILNFLQKRKEQIASSLKKAEEIEKEKKELEQLSQEIIAQTKKEAESILKEERKNGQEMKKQIKEEAQKQAHLLLLKAEKEIENHKERLVEEVKGEIAKLVIEATKSLVSNSASLPNKEEVVKILDEIK